MSYTQHIWRPSDIITADRLNNIEEGIVSLGHGKIKCIDNYYDEPSGHHILDISIEEIYQYVKDGYQVLGDNRLPESKDKDILTKDALLKKPYAERMQLYNENPEA